MSNNIQTVMDVDAASGRGDVEGAGQWPRGRQAARSAWSRSLFETGREPGEIGVRVLDDRGSISSWPTVSIDDDSRLHASCEGPSPGYTRRRSPWSSALWQCAPRCGRTPPSARSRRRRPWCEARPA